jgi:hypothetical protein
MPGVLWFRDLRLLRVPAVPSRSASGNGCWELRCGPQKRLRCLMRAKSERGAGAGYRPWRGRVLAPPRTCPSRWFLEHTGAGGWSRGSPCGVVPDSRWGPARESELCSVSVALRPVTPAPLPHAPFRGSYQVAGAPDKDRVDPVTSLFRTTGCGPPRAALHSRRSAGNRAPRERY